MMDVAQLIEALTRYDPTLEVVVLLNGQHRDLIADFEGESWTLPVVILEAQ
jgi:hypothetical protein